MKTTEEMIAVMQAYKDGKKIELSSCSEDDWQICVVEPEWNWAKCDYRIKSEPKYRPFKSSKEVTRVIEEHRSILKSKFSSNYVVVQEWNEGYIWLPTSSKSFSEAFDEFIFADDTPFGVKEE